MDYNIHPTSPLSSASSGSSPAREGSLRLLCDEDLKREGIDVVIQRLRYVESENKKLLIERSKAMKDVNKKLQVHLLEVRGVREVNQRLMQEKDHLLKEKEELASICCFLDDDREKAKKVAREWQMFGRYATGVLQKELATCHVKVKELEQRQVLLAQENKNLKEICLMLDNEQAGSRSSVDSQNSFPCHSSGLLNVNGVRDAGDGSSNGSTASTCSPDHRQSNNNKEVLYSSDPSQGESYVRYLEHKVRHLEEEAKGRVKRVTIPSTASGLPPSHQPSIGPPGRLERKFFSSSVLPTSSQTAENKFNQPSASAHLSGSDGNITLSSSLNPSALVHSLKTLEPGDHVNNPHSVYDPIDDKEKEMVREMCNVMWRKLGDQGKVMGGRMGVARAASVSNL